MILMLHIIVGLTSLLFGALGVAKVTSSYLKLQVGSFGLTLVSGVVLVLMQPNTLLHLCISGAIFSTISIGLMLQTRRKIAYTR